MAIQPSTDTAGPSQRPPNPIADLAAGALGGPDCVAWPAFERAWMSLERFVAIRLRRSGWPPDQIEDCGQNVFSRVWQYRRTFRGETEGQFWSWVLTICDNEVRRMAERGRGRPSMFPSSPELSSEGSEGREPNPDATAALEEELRRLRTCLSRLDEKQRMVIELTYFEPALTERAAAALLAISPSYVHKIKAKSLALLEDCLRQKGVE